MKTKTNFGYKKTPITGTIALLSSSKHRVLFNYTRHHVLPREHLQQVQGGLHLVHEEEGCAVTDQKSYSHSELYHSLLKLFVDVDTNKDRLISRASFPKIIDAAAATTKA